MIPVVFVHGFMGGSRQWQQQVDALGASEVIALDLPGYGANAHLAAFDSIADIANWALEELSNRGAQRFHLIGHSMGGMVAQEMIAQAPDRVGRLVLYGTGAQGVLPGRFETIETSKRRAQSEGPRATARRIAATWFLANESAPGFTSCAEIAEQSSSQAIDAGLDAMNGWTGAAHLSSIDAPTLVIWGDRDRTYQWPQTERLWQSINGANLAVLPACSHAAHLEKPDLFNGIVNDFLAS